MRVEDWGLIPYQEALRRQEELVEIVHQQNSPGVLVFCTHPPVVTLGRKTQPDDVTAWSGELVPVSRGGRATYHGPNQIVIYPIFNLSHDLGLGFPPKDIDAFLRMLEMKVIQFLSIYGLEGYRFGNEAGVWVKVRGQDRKISSIGVAVRHWVSYHGISFNVEGDEALYSGIRPCGLEPFVLTSLQEVLGSKAPDYQKALSDFKKIWAHS
jgi:lipoyl(octanoyl) transferase